MGKRFRTGNLDQTLLLPPSLHDWLPEGHLARFMADVTEELDLGSIYRSYEGDGRGMAAYQPLMMLRVVTAGEWPAAGRSSRRPAKTWRSGFCRRTRIRITTPSRPSVSATWMR